MLCNQFEAGVLSPALTGTLTNTRVAALTDLAYRNIRSSGLQAQLDKRAGRNADLVDEVDAKVGGRGAVVVMPGWYVGGCGGRVSEFDRGGGVGG
jgi:hypothetical protein